MSITTEKTVREVALENPAATRIFEKLGIDYCCGGNRSLEEACRTANLPMDEGTGKSARNGRAVCTRRPKGP